MSKKGKTAYKTFASGTATQIILGESKDRKSWLVYNTHSATSARIGSSRSGVSGATEYMSIPPNSAVSCKIPEDNPREAMYARCGSGVTLLVYEAYAK